MVHNRMISSIDKTTNEEQAGFKEGKNLTGQILNLCQHNEDFFEEKQLVSAVFIDLTAAYDTVNKRRMLHKLNEATLDSHLTVLIGEQLSNRRFFVQMEPRKSRWRNAKNGLPQEGVKGPSNVQHLHQRSTAAGIH